MRDIYVCIMLCGVYLMYMFEWMNDVSICITVLVTTKGYICHCRRYLNIEAWVDAETGTWWFGSILWKIQNLL